MPPKPSFTPLQRANPCSKCPNSHIAQQIRHATLLRRPHRPYTFTQLVQLSDGSTYIQRSTSPSPVLKSTKDTRNSILWQPHLSSLKNLEKDEAGKLKAFREKFGRGWDIAGEEREGENGEEYEGKGQSDLMDLISGSAWEDNSGVGEGRAKRRDGGEWEKKMVTVMRGGKMVKLPAMTTAEKKEAAKDEKK